MQSVLLNENLEIESAFLQRNVKIDCFLPANVSDPASIHLLIINDGQNLNELGLYGILKKLYEKKEIDPLLCVGIHAGDRMVEYGTASFLIIVAEATRPVHMRILFLMN